MSQGPTKITTPPKRSKLFFSLRNRVIQGVLVAAPAAITFWIITWLYQLLRDTLLDPVAHFIVYVAGSGSGDTPQLPDWFQYYAAPVIAVLVVVIVLYVLGLFLNSRLHRAIDWLLMRVPIVTTVYASVRKVLDTIQMQDASDRFKRVVLVAFPHPGIRTPAFVTSTCRDAATGKNILCVYVPTTPVPTSGYMLLIPEEDVTDLSWDLQETLQAIVSGGITVPETVDYYRAAIEPADQAGEEKSADS